MATLKDFQKQYDISISELRLIYRVDHVCNYDQIPISSFVKRLGFSWYDFKKVGDRTYTDGKIKVLTIDFEFYHKRRKENIFLTGYNKCSTPFYHDKGEFYDKSLNLILPFDTEQAEQLKANYLQDQQEKKEWQAFESIKKNLSNSELGTRFEIGETVYWYFLEVLPPIYGKGCFYCSEAVKHTPQGKTVYHCFRKLEEKFYIEENIVE